MQKNLNVNPFLVLFPILFRFFVMGFVDIVGIATSYVKQDFSLNDKLANLLPLMVFLWFAICSFPTSIIMGRIGRKKTVLLSALVTSIGMVIPIFNYSFSTILAAFAFLGIGNTILQVSLNPLLTSVVEKGKITSMLTLGQFIKAISSFLGPIVIGIAVSFWGNWKYIFPIYLALTLLSFIWLYGSPVTGNKEESLEKNAGHKMLSLLKDTYLLSLFSVIVLIVGFEIGLMTAVPKYLHEYCQLPLEKGGLGCSLYYIARTLGTFIGSILLAKVASRKVFIVSMFIAIASFLTFMFIKDTIIILVSLFIIGLSCANVFPIIFSNAIQSDSSKINEISALMIMGVAGGALIPPVMGIISDVTNQLTSLFVLLGILFYMLFVALYILKK